MASRPPDRQAPPGPPDPPASSPGERATAVRGEDVEPKARRSRRGAWSVAVAAAFGVLGGLGAFTFGYGDGTAYLSNEPTACTNCHVMQGHFDSWVKSSHHGVATCNDCHLPHDFAGKWLVKADNGFFHSLAFTTNDFHEPIQIKARNRRVTQNACLHCHGDLVHSMFPVERGGDMLWCVHCHSDVGHAGE